MPVMLESVNDCDTLNTIVIRALKLCEEFNQTHSIIMADEAVYSGLIKLRWVTPGYHQRLILRLGGLHVSMAFEATIGQHMAGSGLLDAWIESGLFGSRTAEQGT